MHWGSPWDEHAAISRAFDEATEARRRFQTVVFDKAVEVLARLTGLPRADVEAEVERRFELKRANR